MHGADVHGELRARHEQRRARACDDGVVHVASKPAGGEGDLGEEQGDEQRRYDAADVVDERRGGARTLPSAASPSATPATARGCFRRACEWCSWVPLFLRALLWGLKRKNKTYNHLYIYKVNL